MSEEILFLYRSKILKIEFWTLLSSNERTMLRLLELVLPEKEVSQVPEILDHGDDFSYIDFWVTGERAEDEFAVVRVLALAKFSGKIADVLEDELSGSGRFRLTTLSVEATLPRPEEVETEEEKRRGSSRERIGREELYNDIAGSAVLSGEYLLLVSLSTVVAAIGLLKNNAAIVIGAMVIAPLLGPSMALSLATTLGDLSLIRKSIKTGLAGITVGFFLSFVFGLLFSIDPSASQVVLRTSVDHWDVILALAVGVAGALAFTTGISSALVGVMVAVALLPPLVTFGMLVGSADFVPAVGAIILTAVNLVGINLAGVTTFVVRGIRPAKWWEADRAKKRTRSALILWLLTLAFLVALVELARRLGP